MTKTTRQDEEPQEPGPVGRALARLIADAASMRQLSKDIGLSEKAVQHIINGVSQDPKGSTVLALAKHLKVPVQALLDGTASRDMVGFTSDPNNLSQDSLTHFLLRSWEQLAQEDRVEVLKFIKFRLSLVPSDEAPSGRKEV
ncbi:helix-turn-helix domain-containing protein [Muricoccus vinaceus]|uniref:Helix-turn-helix domain-containing protein n=1 Tax=Muricoccus vinaceus TaxID=424704 RepID=A0ABV6IL72_9PROT